MGVVIGIDVGNKGGITLMDLEGNVLATHRMPTRPGKRETVDGVALARIIRGPAPLVRLLCFEKIGHMGKAERNGPVGVASASRAAGVIEGICCATDTPFEEVSPQRWQVLVVGVPHPRAPRDADAKAKEAARKQWKAEIVNAAGRRWPHADLVGSKHASATRSSGIADSLFIAEYARFRVTGKTLAVKEIA